NKTVSRRKWLEQMSLPPIAATLGSTFLGTRSAAARQPRSIALAENSLGARVYNVRDFGAKGDGSTLDTAAVQAAIDASNRDKGGTVLVPASDFVVGTLELKSNVTL